MRVNEWEVLTVREANNLGSEYENERLRLQSTDSDLIAKHHADTMYEISFKLARFFEKTGNKQTAHIWAERRNSAYENSSKFFMRLNSKTETEGTN